MRPFGAPDRTVAIPHRGWRTFEGLSGGNNQCGKKQLNIMIPKRTVHGSQTCVVKAKR